MATAASVGAATDEQSPELMSLIRLKHQLNTGAIDAKMYAAERVRLVNVATHTRDPWAPEDEEVHHFCESESDEEEEEAEFKDATVLEMERLLGEMERETLDRHEKAKKKTDLGAMLVALGQAHHHLRTEYVVKSSVYERTYAPGEVEMLQAAQTGNVAVMQALLEEESVSVECRHTVCLDTPLILAARHGQLGAVEWLLSQQVQVNTRNLQGKTALHASCESLSVESCSPACAEALIHVGGNPHVVDNAGCTPFMYADAEMEHRLWACYESTHPDGDPFLAALPGGEDPVTETLVPHSAVQVYTRAGTMVSAVGPVRMTVEEGTRRLCQQLGLPANTVSSMRLYLWVQPKKQLKELPLGAPLVPLYKKIPTAAAVRGSLPPVRIILAPAKGCDVSIVVKYRSAISAGR